jgi:hypothetical protein
MTTQDGSDSSPTAIAEPPCSEEELCSEEEFAQEIREIVAEEAPRVFALVEEHGERVDGWIVGWGLAFDDRVEVLGANGRLRMTLNSVERAYRVFSRRRKIRLVWTQPAVSGYASDST